MWQSHRPWQTDSQLIARFPVNSIAGSEVWPLQNSDYSMCVCVGGGALLRLHLVPQWSFMVVNFWQLLLTVTKIKNAFTGWPKLSGAGLWHVAGQAWPSARSGQRGENYPEGQHQQSAGEERQTRRTDREDRRPTGLREYLIIMTMLQAELAVLWFMGLLCHNVFISTYFKPQCC